MSKKVIDVNAINRVKLAFATLIANVCIAAVCIVAIIMLFVGNFWSINIKMVVDDSLISQIMPNISMNDTSRDDGILTMTSQKSSLAAIPEKDRTISLNIDLQASVVVNSVVAEDSAIAKNFFDAQVQNIINQTLPILKVVVKVGVNTIVVNAVDVLKGTLRQNGIEESELEQELKNLGIVVDDLVKDTTGVVEKLFNENPNTAEIKTDMINIIDNVMSKQGDEESTKNVIDNFSKIYDDLIASGTSENGDFDPTKLIDGLLKQLNDSNAKTSAVTRLSATYFGALEDTVTDAINSFVPQDMANTISLVIRIIGIVMVLLIITWAYILLKIVLKTFFAKNKTVRVGLPCTFGIIMFVLLVIAPAIIMSVFADSISSAMPGLSLTFASSSFLAAFICSIVLIIFSFFYRKYRLQYRAIIIADRVGSRASSSSHAAENIDNIVKTQSVDEKIEDTEGAKRSQSQTETEDIQDSNIE